MALRSRTAAVGLSLSLFACAGSDGSTPATQDGAPEEVSGDLLVFAAASLTDAFEELAEVFETEHPGVSVTYNFAGSQTLAAQLVAGAPADVFASADDTRLDVVDGAGLVEPRAPFATNRLAIAVEPGNPLDIRSLADLARDDVVLVMAAAEVPAGRYAAEALASAGVELAPASLEVDVRSALGKVELGEADAAIVYASDVVAAGEAVEAVDVPDEHDVVASYAVARLVDAPNPDAAEAFLALLHSTQGRDVLAVHGFGSP